MPSMPAVRKHFMMRKTLVSCFCKITCETIVSFQVLGIFFPPKMLKPVLKEKGDLVQERMGETQVWDLESKMGPTHRERQPLMS